MVQMVFKLENHELAPALERTARLVSSAVAESWASVPCLAAMVVVVYVVVVALFVLCVVLWFGNSRIGWFLNES